VSLLEGRATVTAGGVVELWHRGCWFVRDIPVVPPARVVALPDLDTPRRSLARVWLVGTGVGVIAAALVAGSWATRAQPASLVAVELVSYESAEPPTLGTAREQHGPRAVTVETSEQARHPVPDAKGRPLDDRYPSLAHWVHPVTRSPELMPQQGSRLFGAERIGIDRSECGAGHCGIDLDGPRGRPIVAVAAGRVVRVERHELGLDGKSGRYVRIQHDDGALTAYMHLDVVADELEVGDRVDSGQYLGTLGATAVYASVPHLHFSLEVPLYGGDGDITDTRYVDPAPFLVRSTIVPVADHPHTAERRHHAERPAL